MSVRTWVKFHTQGGFKMHRLTLLSRTVCRWFGHRRSAIATDWLGVCDRCCRDWQPLTLTVTVKPDESAAEAIQRAMTEASWRGSRA